MKNRQLRKNKLNKDNNHKVDNNYDGEPKPSNFCEIESNEESLDFDDIKTIHTTKRKDKSPKGNTRNKAIRWAVIVTFTTFILALFFSFAAEITASRAGVIFSFVILIILILLSYIFDAIGVAATASEEQPFHSMASKKVKGAKMAIFLVKNAEKVSSICCDVIGDICGIISGACAISIVLMLTTKVENDQYRFWITIGFSALISAITVGGKAVLKIFAIKKSKEIILRTAKFISIFSRNK